MQVVFSVSLVYELSFNTLLSKPEQLIVEPDRLNLHMVDCRVKDFWLFRYFDNRLSLDFFCGLLEIVVVMGSCINDGVAFDHVR